MHYCIIITVIWNPIAIALSSFIDSTIWSALHIACFSYPHLHIGGDCEAFNSNVAFKFNGKAPYFKVLMGSCSPTVAMKLNKGIFQYCELQLFYCENFVESGCLICLNDFSRLYISIRVS